MQLYSSHRKELLNAWKIKASKASAVKKEELSKQFF